MPRVYFTVVISGTAWISLALLLFFIYQENRDLFRNVASAGGSHGDPKRAAHHPRDRIHGQGGGGGGGGDAAGDSNRYPQHAKRRRASDHGGDGGRGGGDDPLDPMLGRLDIDIPRYGPGEGGQAVMLSGEALERAKQTLHLHNFNLVVSDKISVERSLPDVRDQRCLDITYKYSRLQSASVIIAFHNEAWSTLMRTVHSVVNRTPPDILTEVILVDDGSTDEELRRRLQNIPGLVRPKVRLIHLEQRAGVSKAKARGTREARGDVLVFLDSHCEVNTHWLEPMLDILHQSTTAVVSPIIDRIDGETFAYEPRPLGRITFTWGLETRPVPLTNGERAERRNPLEPVRSPLTSGGIFAVTKSFLSQLGGLDEGLVGWGGESIDFSFKTWMCGGQVYVVPCSRVGHVDRRAPPYLDQRRVESTRQRSLARVAEQWMGRYKEEFYSAVPHAKDRYIGDIADTKKKLASLNCNDFDWYLSHVVPLLLATASSARLAWGQIQNENTYLCITGPIGGEGKKITLERCDSTNTRQFLLLTRDHEIRSGDLCLDLSDYRIGQHATLEQCHGQHGSQEWGHTEPGELRHTESGYCLDISVGAVQKPQLLTNQCTHYTNQRWEFTHYTKSTRPTTLHSANQRWDLTHYTENTRL